MSVAGHTWKWSEESRAKLSKAHKNLKPEAEAARLIKIARARTFITPESSRKVSEGVKAFHAPFKSVRREVAKLQQEFHCSGCKQTLPRSEFSEKKTTIHVRPVASRCKPCESARVKALPPRDPLKTAANRARSGRSLIRRYGSLRSAAALRGIALEISLDEYKALMTDAVCNYCEYRIESGGGLDRIDCSQTYSLNNVVPACAVCNIAKSDLFNFEQMKVLGAFVKQWRVDGSLKLPRRLIAGKRHKALTDSQ